MRYLMLLLLLSTAAASAQDADVKRTIATFFEGLHTSDTLKMKSVCSDKLILQTIKDEKNGATLKEEPVHGFYASIAALPRELRIEERITDYKILTDGGLAHAWTLYEFYVNGQLSHTGINSFTLFNDGSGWKIIHIIDTRHRRKA